MRKKKQKTAINIIVRSVQNNIRQETQKTGKCPPPPSDGIKNGTVKPTYYHPMFSKMQQREVIAEIRERLNYLRDMGWKFEGNLTFVETKTVKL